MVYGVIDTKSCRCYTFLKAVFDAVDNSQIDYNWLITDSEIVAHSDKLNALNTSVHWLYKNGKSVAVPAADYCYLSGEELTEIVTEDDSQWIWGVLSGFDRTIPLEEILKYPLPKADGYPGFWKKPLSLQHPLASIEIVPWDSSFVLILSKEKKIIDRFREAVPLCRDLSEVNASDHTENNNIL